MSVTIGTAEVHTLDGPVQLVCKLNHCPDPRCPGHAKTKSPELEVTIALPKWAIGWDVFCWIGHRRFARHWSISQIQSELRDDYGIKVSDDAIDQVHPALPGHARRASARPRGPAAAIRFGRRDHPLDRRPPTREGTRDSLRRQGTDPEAGVVRRAVDLRHGGRSPTVDQEGQSLGRILGQAGGPLVVGQAGRVRHGDRGGIPRRAASLLRQPLPPRRGQARSGGRQSSKVAMRKKVRGLRKIEQAVLKRQSVEESQRHAPDDSVVMTSVGVGPMDTPAAVPDADSADGVVLAYCAAVRGILNDDQGGPLHPPGLRMAEALGEIRESIQRNVDEQKGGSPNSNSADWPGVSTVDSKPFETNKRRSERTSRTSKKSPQPSNPESGPGSGGKRRLKN